MMSAIKKIFFLSLLLLFLTGLFWGVYNLSFKDRIAGEMKKADEKTAEKAEAGKELKVPQKLSKDKIVALTDEAIISPSLSTVGDSVVYYGKESGQANKIDFFGSKKEIIASQKFSNLESAEWNFDKTKAILKIKDGEGYVFKYFDFATSSIQDLKKNVDEVTWQINANRIFYKYYEATNEKRSINVADPDGSNWQYLIDIPYRNVEIAQIPMSGLISYWNIEDSYSATELGSIPIAGGEAKIIFKDGYGADYVWDPSGQRAIVSRVDSKGAGKMQLGIINYNGGEYRNLDIPTFASKCVWSKNGKIIYYALPGGIPESAVLPNDYKDGKFTTVDTFWKVDVTSGEKTRLVEITDITARLDATNLFFDASESLLFFQNKIDGKLYKITL